LNGRDAHQIGVAYQRWRTATSRPAPSKVVVEKPAPSTESADNETLRDAASDRTRNRLRALVVGSVAAVLAAAVGGAALWLNGTSPRLPNQTPPSVLEQAREATNIGLAWAVDRLGLAAGDVLDTSAEPPLESAEPPLKPTRPSAARRVVPSANAVRSSSASRVDVVLAPETTETPEPATTPRGAAVASGEPEVVLAPTGIVYTSADPDVQPPVAIHPQMPPSDHLDPSHDDVASMEIWVSPTGAVEHVRLMPGAQYRMSHVMLLSAAKTWQFAPAMRDGHPVPYRLKQLWLVTR